MGWSIGIGIILLIGILAWLSTRDRHLADVSIGSGEVIVRLRGLNRLWALRNEIHIPQAQIREARVLTDTRELPKGWRAPGTAIPGLIVAGTYRSRGERSFYAFRDGENLLLLELAGHTFSRVAVQTRDAARIAEALSPAGPPV